MEKESVVDVPSHKKKKAVRMRTAFVFDRFTGGEQGFSRDVGTQRF